MTLAIESSPRFKKEITQYKEKIAKITNESLKSELEGYLKTLISEVKNLDIMHGELAVRKDLPSGVLDSRNNIVSVRKKLEKKLESWERAQKS